MFTKPAPIPPNGVISVATPETTSAQTVAMGCHAPETLSGHVMDFHMRGPFGQEMLRGMAQDAMDGHGLDPREREGYHSWAGSRLALSDEQRARAKQITDVVYRQQWLLKGKLGQEKDKLRDLLEEQTPDPKTVGSIYAALSKLHQQMLETHLQARNAFHALLTPKQREEAEQQWRYERSLERNGHGYRRGMTPR